MNTNSDHTQTGESVEFEVTNEFEETQAEKSEKDFFQTLGEIMKGMEEIAKELDDNIKNN
jgi:hypothetical protein